jgi:chromosome segregation ATPase
MFKRNTKVVSYGLIICLVSLMLVFKGCGSEKREQAANSQEPGISEQQQKARDEKLSILDNERKLLQEKMEQYRQTIQKLAQEYGSVDLSARRDLVKQRAKSLLDELTDIEANRIRLEAKIKMLEQKEAKEAEDEQKLASLKSELEPVKEAEKRMRETLAKEDAESIELTRKQQTINEYQDKLKLTKEMYDTVCLRLQELESTQQNL